MHIKAYRESVSPTTNKILDILIEGSAHRKKLHFPLNYVIRVDDRHLIFTDDARAPTLIIDLWLREHCKHGYGNLIAYTHIGFEDENEAIQFKLTWG